MNRKFIKPTISVVPMEGRQHLLSGSQGGVNATISGYGQDDAGGFSQSREKKETKHTIWE